MSTKSIDAAISTSEAAVLLKLSGRRTRELCESGFIDRLADDRVTIRSAVWGWLRFWQESDRRQAARDAEGKRFRDARARSFEVKNAQREGRLVDLQEHLDLFGEVFGTLKSGLDGVPAEVTTDQAMRGKIEAAINDVLQRAADLFEAATKDVVEDTKARGTRR